MLSEAGVSARYVFGTGHGENHLWNLVYLEGKWYHLDCTWNDPTPDTPSKVRYNYYNLSDHPYWTITFSQDVDEKSVSSRNIFVGNDPEGTTSLPGVPVPQLVNAKQIRLNPPCGQWHPGTYYLLSVRILSLSATKPWKKVYA